MAIQKRLLSKLKNAYAALEMVPVGNLGDTYVLLQRIKEAQVLCRKGLPKTAYGEYGEIYDGLVTALNQVLSGKAGNDSQEILFLCKELLQELVEETTKENKFKKEMFFLPYKASMWDSLESVWKAADEDKENCLAYVMPIPYCDRNPDGTAREWHCERDLFPKDVPTLDWREIDLKLMHPDVILYHYPYDNCNVVTSVDEAYYSSNLKECADKLVYIPYFVLGEPELDYDAPEKVEKVQEAEEKIAHFILQPGVFNADCTIVQSEAMKKVYVNVLTRHTNADRDYWEEHILGLGSPKFDKVAVARKEDYELPEEWAKLIKGKKTILYNTGLTAMLKHTDKFIKKIRSVLKTFKIHDDVVLWWRPHPLLRSTFRSMHPELLEDYDEIVKAYQQEGWGIYDDTAELERAVAYTDGYYGDWSSVVQLYEKTGKRVFIQDFTGEYSKKREFNGNTHFMDVAYNGEYTYFSETSFNGLFRYREGDNKAEFLGRFPDEDLWQRDLHRNVFRFGEKLYFMPMNGHGISIYDCSNKEFRMLKIPGAKKAEVQINQCIKRDNKILLIPVNLDTPFSIFDIKNEEFCVLPYISARIATIIPLPTRYEMFSAYCAVWINDCLYVAISSTNYILKISLKKHTVERKILPVKVHLRNMSYMDGWFYFTAKEHSIVAYREKDDAYHCFEIPGNVMESDYPYLKVVSYKNYIYVLSGREDRLWKTNLQNGDWFDLMKHVPVGFERDLLGALLFFGYEQDRNQILLFPRSGNGSLLLDLDKEEFSFNSVEYSKDIAVKLEEDWSKSVLSNRMMLYEWEYPLIYYLGNIEQDIDLECRSNNLEFVGREIYKNAYGFL